MFIISNDVFLNSVKLVNKEENHMATPEMTPTNMLFGLLCLMACLGSRGKRERYKNP